MGAELTGYTNKLSVAPGDRLRFMVSTDAPGYEARIVRLIHGDENPAGPGFKEQSIEAKVNGQYSGRKQVAHAGSYLRVEDHPALDHLSSLTLQTWIYPTTPRRESAQGLLAKWSVERKRGYALVIEPEGDLAFWTWDSASTIRKVRIGQPLRASEWYFVAASYSAASHQVCLYQKAVSRWLLDSPGIVEKNLRAECAAGSGAPLVMAALYLEGPEQGPGRKPARHLYNGKIENPRIFQRALNSREIESLENGADPMQLGGADLVAAWDFSVDIPSSRITDTSANRLSGRTVNQPARAMTGHRWSGEECDFRRAPEQYGAIHFHEDDLDDAQWECDFEWTVPQLKSGFYAGRLTAEGLEDYLPFFVRPKRGTATAPIAFLAPTLTYLAYANERQMPASDLTFPDMIGRKVEAVPSDRYLAQHPEFAMSVYDRHSDGSGCSYSSRLRPVVNMRPKYRMWLPGAPRHFSSDLHLIDWLEQKQLPYDVITDEDLHHEGRQLLSLYKVVITGSHPEYCTRPMLEGLEQYLLSGGRMMYLGGNGFYWVTSIGKETPHLIEVRRGNTGTRSCDSAPGESHHSTTGQLGGIWRHSRKPSNQMAGVGFGAMGWDTQSYGYVRKPGSFEERARFIFEGIGEDEVIGNFGLVVESAVGDEVDRLDYSLGTPPHALLLASSEGHSHYYQPVIEDLLQLTPRLLLGKDPNVRADMVYFETPNGGAVFSVGSISWTGSLSHNRYQNNVSRITENVLRRFMTAT